MAMTRYINSDKLIAEIEEREKQLSILSVEELTRPDYRYIDGMLTAFDRMREIINSLREEDALQVESLN